TDEDVSTLRKYVELSKAGMKEGDRLCVLKNDREMHMYLAQMTKNKFIIPELERIRDFLDWLILFKRARMMEALSEHDRLIECLSLRDTKGAVKAIRQHINNALQSTLDSLKADQPQQATEGQDT
ncbi:MAG: FCD domain-containing protein, partial [Deltaproteobacteria bacterium]|nr:FCD domain-containing protein [Deltaproteobacteria bacterium]